MAPWGTAAARQAALSAEGHLKLQFASSGSGGGEEVEEDELVALVDKAWDDCSAFCDYWMLGGGVERVQLLTDPGRLGALGGRLSTGQLPPLHLGADTPTQAALACLLLGNFGQGDKRSRSKQAVEALTNCRGWMGPGMGAKIAAASGMGKATSYFAGASLLKLQAIVARDFIQPLYNQQRGDEIPPALTAATEQAATALLAVAGELDPDQRITDAYTCLLDEKQKVGGKFCCDPREQPP
jgi:hypothetical protein